MNQELKINHENYVALSKDMIRITDAILKNVISRTEQAALEIGEKIQTLSHLTEDQANTVKSLITSIYEEGTQENKEVAKLAQEANNLADKIFESAIKGDMQTAHKIGNSEHYKHTGHKASAVAKQLEKLSQSDKELANMVGPVIMALQFQDSIRQSLENLILCFKQLNDESKDMTQAKVPTIFAEKFWSTVENKFASIEERNLVRRVIYGENAKVIEAQTKDDPFLF